ncbi:MAG: hypothetical protein IT299_09865 [Dehalococcoidia bacterium]|nr:hypothetical protein [Dehalococcoidia bacterium]
MLAARRQPLFWVVLAALALVLVGRAAFAAANTVPQSSAGAGSAAVSGFTITAIDYNLNATNPLNLDTATFTATADNGETGTALTIRVRFDASTSDWYECSRTGGVAPAHNISCTVDGSGTPAVQLTVANVDTFEAVIVQQ